MLKWRRFLRLAPAGMMAALLTACSGHGEPATPLAVATPVAVATSGATSSASALPVTFRFTIPASAAQSAATGRSPQYLPFETGSIQINWNMIGGGPITPQISTFTVTPGSGNCPSPGSEITCTESVPVLPGSDGFTFSAYDSSTQNASTLLSIQKATFNVVVAAANSFDVVFDAQTAANACGTAPVSITVNLPTGTSGAVCSGTSQGTVNLNTTSSLTFAVDLLSAAGPSIPPNAPGAPVITVTASGSAATLTSTSQGDATNPYSFTILPSAALGTSGTITISVAGATAGDGVTTRTLTFAIVRPATTLIAAGGCGTASTCAVDVFSYSATGFAKTGHLAPASFGAHEVSTLVFDSAHTLYDGDESGNDGVLEFAYASLQNPAGTNAPAPTTIATQGLSVLNGIDVSPAGDLATANGTQGGGGAASPINFQLVAYAPGSTFPSLEKEFGTASSQTAISGNAVAVMTTPTGTLIGYAIALFNSMTNAAEVDAVFPNGTGGAVCFSPGAPEPCTDIQLSASQNVLGDGYIDLVWDRADQALIVANYENSTSPANFNLEQFDLTLTGTTYSFGSAITLAAPASANTGAYASVGDDLSVSPDGHVAAVFGTAGANYAIEIFNPGTTSAARTLTTGWAPNTSFPQSNQITAIQFLEDNSPVITTTATTNNLCVYNLTTAALKTGSATTSCVSEANVNDTAVSGLSTHRHSPRAHDGSLRFTPRTSSATR